MMVDTEVVDHGEVPLKNEDQLPSELRNMRRFGKNIKWNEENETIFLELILAHQAHRKTGKKREVKWNELSQDLFSHPNFVDYDRGTPSSLQRKFQRLKTAFFQKYNSAMSSSLPNNNDFPPRDNRRDALLFQLLYDNPDRYDMMDDEEDESDGGGAPGGRDSLMPVPIDVSGGGGGGDNNTTTATTGGGLNTSATTAGVHMLSPTNVFPHNNNNNNNNNQRRYENMNTAVMKRKRRESDNGDLDRERERERRRIEWAEELQLLRAEAELEYRQLIEEQKLIQLENENLRLQKDVEHARADRAKSETMLHITEMLHDLQKQLQVQQSSAGNASDV
jgi:hypothetical protein